MKLHSGEEKTGVILDEGHSGMDAGPIIDSESLLIEDNDTGSDVRKKLPCCIPLLREISTVCSQVIILALNRMKKRRVIAANY